VCCSVLQCMCRRCGGVEQSRRQWVFVAGCCRMLQGVAVCCNTLLQCVAIYSGALLQLSLSRLATDGYVCEFLFSYAYISLRRCSVSLLITETK